MYKAIRADYFFGDVEGNQPPADAPASSGTFKVKFRRLKRSAFNALSESRPSDTEFVDAVVLEVQQYAAPDGTILPSDDAILEIKDDMALTASVVRAFIDGLSGASAKNSKPQRAR